MSAEREWAGVPERDPSAARLRRVAGILEGDGRWRLGGDVRAAANRMESLEAAASLMGEWMTADDPFADDWPTRIADALAVIEGATR